MYGRNVFVFAFQPPDAVAPLKFAPFTTPAKGGQVELYHSRGTASSQGTASRTLPLPSSTTPKGRQVAKGRQAELGLTHARRREPMPGCEPMRGEEQAEVL